MSGCQAVSVVGLMLAGLEPIQKLWGLFFCWRNPKACKFTEV
jgi:hypothetical protein